MSKKQKQIKVEVEKPQVQEEVVVETPQVIEQPKAKTNVMEKPLPTPKDTWEIKDRNYYLATHTSPVRGVIVPAGTSSVYDQSLGKNLKRPFLHVRYRASQVDNRRFICCY